VLHPFTALQQSVIIFNAKTLGRDFEHWRTGSCLQDINLKNYNILEIEKL
jgi:hypothetical protein